jgi:hypothetical protein
MTAFEPLKRFAAFGFALVGMAQAVSAQPQPASSGQPEVEVRSVKFSNVRAPGGGTDPWYEAAIELTVRGETPAGATAPSRFVDRVQVSFGLGVRTRGGEFDFYRSSAEAVSLEVGRAVVRFYLPPEIANREQISGEPYAFSVDLAVRGRPLVAVPSAVAAVLRSPEALRSFKDRVTRAAPLNDGVLVPQFETPFAGLYAGDTPSFVRRPR